MPQESQLWARLIAALSGDTYVSPLEQAEDPNLSDMDRLYNERRKDALRRSMRLGTEGPSSEPRPAPFSSSPDPSRAVVDEVPWGRTPQPGDINVEQLSSYEFPQEGVPSGRATDKIDLPEQRQATADDGSYPYDYDPKEYLRDYASNMDADKLRKIKEQAFIKGKAGDLSASVDGERPYGPQGQFRGGSFSQQDESPELTMRLADRDRFIADQGLRDAQWDKDLARQRRDPQGMQAASDSMINLKNQASVDRRNMMLEGIVQKIGKNGKIPYAEATQLRQLGLPIDLTMMGSDPDTVSRYFQGLQAAGGEFLATLDPIEIAGNPELLKRADIEKKLMMLAAEYDKKLKSGFDPDEARREYDRAAQNFIIANGLGNLYQIKNGQLNEASK